MHVYDNNLNRLEGVTEKIVEDVDKFDGEQLRRLTESAVRLAEALSRTAEHTKSTSQLHREFIQKLDTPTEE